jgi:hypothetical protein
MDRLRSARQSAGAFAEETMAMREFGLCMQMLSRGVEFPAPRHARKDVSQLGTLAHPVEASPPAVNR